MFDPAAKSVSVQPEHTVKFVTAVAVATEGSTNEFDWEYSFSKDSYEDLYAQLLEH